MLKLSKLFTSKLSVKISMKVVLLVAVLLAAALFTMLHFSRKTLRQEAMLKAEQTLESTVEHIDNVLLSVEQSAGNVYFNMCRHLDNPEMMYMYSRSLVESNPYISGCAIAFEPYYYKDRGEQFMAYYRRSGTGAEAVREESFGSTPYHQQSWYAETLKKGTPLWTGPLDELDADSETIITFCLPISDSKGKRIGVMGVDVTLNMLSRIVLSAKPSEHSFCVLLNSNGSYLVHPDKPSQEAADVMMAGEKGYQQITMAGKDYYVFYEPFKRDAVQGRYLENLGWRVGIVYPKDDIFGDYDRLLITVILIAVLGILLLALLCQFFIHRRLLPLIFLTKSAHRIASGHYDEPIPDSRQHDEIGQLQNHFQQMQQALAKHVNELEKLDVELQGQGERLRVAYHQAQAADRLRTSFLHNMTNQMLTPVQIILDRVNKLSRPQTSDPHDIDSMADDIQKQGELITELLNHLLELSRETTGKEEENG
jgi:HAMP domain-containing protein